MFRQLNQILLLALISAPGVVRGAEPSPENTLDVLQAQRIEVLQQAVEQAEVLYKAATVPYSEVWEAQRTLLEAKLEQNQSSKDRVAILEEYLAGAKKVEQLAIQLGSGARISSREVSQAKAERLRIEIKLAKAKAKSDVSASFELYQQERFAIHHLQLKQLDWKKAAA